MAGVHIASLLGDVGIATSLAVSSLGVVAAALPVVGPALARRRSSVRRPVILASLAWPLRPGEKRYLAPERARRCRWLGVLFTVVSAAYTALEINLAAASSAATALRWFSVAVGGWGVACGLVLIFNTDVQAAKREALSRTHRVVEMSLMGDAADTLAELLRFLRRHRFEPQFYEYDRCTGTLACNCLRWWYGPLLMPQYLGFVGVVGTDGLRLTILADLMLTSRTDFGRSEKNLKRLVRYFSLPPA